MASSQLRVRCRLLALIFTLLIKESSSTSLSEAKTGASYIFLEKELNGRQIFSWNTAKYSWLQLYARMCGWICDGNTLLEVCHPDRTDPMTCSDICYKCDCEPDCAVYGTCCPQIVPSATLDDSAVVQFDPSSKRYTLKKNISDVELKNGNQYKKYLRSNPNKGMDKRFNEMFQCINVGFDSLNDYKSIFAISYCPDTETDQHLRQLCENYDLEYDYLESISPISDSRNGVVYKNIYCFKCWRHKKSKMLSNVEEDQVSLVNFDKNLFMKWNSYVECEIFQGLYKITNHTQFLLTVLKEIQYQKKHNTPKNMFCVLELKLTVQREKNLVPKECQGYTRPSNAACKGSVYNNDMTAKLCQGLSQPAYSISGGRNIFCSLCNDLVQKCESTTSIQKPFNSVPANFLLENEPSEFHRKHRIKTTTPGYETYLCPRPFEWMDDLDNCRLPTCVDGKVLDLNTGHCRTAINVIENLGYKLSMVLVPDQKISIRDASRIQETVESLYRDMMQSGYLAVYMVVYGADQNDENDIIKIVKIQGHFVAKKGMKRDEFETRFLNYSFKVLLNTSESNSTVTLIQGGLGVDYVAKMLIREYTQGNPEDMLHIPYPGERIVDEMMMGDDPEPKQDMNSLITTSSTSHESHIILKTRKPVLYVAVGDSRNDESIWKWKNEFIDMNPTLKCPYVEFKIKEVTEVNETTLLIKFHYNGKEKTIDTSLHDRNDVTIERKRVKICIGAFREEFQKTVATKPVSNTTDVKFTWMSEVKRHLTICCPVLSVICLIATTVTYCIFSELRTLRGLNTISLCLTLASAHVTLILVVELVGYIDGLVCITLGIALHYTWLCSFFWMGLGCLHMYLVFKSTKRGESASANLSSTDSEIHAQYRICAFGMSAVIVSVYICVCEIASEGATTGYSDQLCFFDTRWSILTLVFSFILPLAVLLLVNAILFGKTVREMAEIKRLQVVRRVKSRDELLIYVKLSAITGLQWLVSLLAISLKSHVTDIAVATLVGLQGVFIFVSFNLNKKTRNLYKTMCCREGGSLMAESSSNRKGHQSSNTQDLFTQVTNA